MLVQLVFLVSPHLIFFNIKKIVRWNFSKKFDYLQAAITFKKISLKEVETLSTVFFFSFFSRVKVFAIIHAEAS